MEDAVGNDNDVGDKASAVVDNGAGGSSDDTVGEGQDRGEQGRDEDENSLDLTLNSDKDIWDIMLVIVL